MNHVEVVFVLYCFYWLCWVLVAMSFPLVAESGVALHCGVQLSLVVASLVAAWAPGCAGFSSCCA